jgi:hypothetical protein
MKMIFGFREADMEAPPVEDIFSIIAFTAGKGKPKKQRNHKTGQKSPPK